MDQFLDKLRRKPERSRRLIALGASAGIVLVIALIWIFTMLATDGFGFAGGGSFTASSSPFVQLGNDMKTAGDSLGSIGGQIQGAFGSATQPQ